VAHLILEGNKAETERVVKFLAKVGLPVHLGQLSLDQSADAGLIDDAMQASVDSGLTGSEPFEVTAARLRKAFDAAHRLGLDVAAAVGDEAYRALHS